MDAHEDLALPSVQTSGLMVINESDNNVQDQESHMRLPKQRKLRSAVWNDMTKQLKGDGSYFAICNHCKKKMLGSSAMGTTHLKNHLRFCAAFRIAKSGQGHVEMNEVVSNVQDQESYLTLPKRRKLRSAVWNEMTKEYKGDGSYVAICNHCKKRMVGNSASGTTHLKNHLRICAAFKISKSSQVNDGQLFLESSERKKVGANNLDCANFDAERSRQDFAHIIESDGNMQDQESYPHLPRRRKLRSAVWNEMTKEQREDGGYFAICNHCKKKMVGNSTRGTTHLKNHLRFCAAFKHSKSGQADVGQLLESSERKKMRNNDLDCFKFDQERSRQDFARMLILHDYPFAMVDHIGFRMFLKNLQPQFKLMSRNTVQADCMKIYENEREKLHEALGTIRSRVSLAASLWNAMGNTQYLCLTCHFIDDNWKLQKKILNFLNINLPHDSVEMSKVIEEKIRDWHIDGKLFNLVVDDSLSNDAVVGEFGYSHFSSELVFDPDLFSMHCCASLLNLIVQDGLKVKEVSSTVERIRASVKHVRKSQTRKECLRRCVQQCGDPGKSLVLDCPTRWQSTYLMLETALEYKNIFSHLTGFDRSYNFPPSSTDWENVQAIVDCLCLFDEATTRFSSTKYPTINFCFVDMCSLHMKLKEWCSSSSQCIHSMALKMLERFANFLSEINMLLAIGSILDPRFKMKSIDYLFGQIYFDDLSARIYDVQGAFLKLYKVYLAQYERIVISQTSHVSINNDNAYGEHGSGRTVQPSNRNTLDCMRKGLGRLLVESSQVQPKKSDIDLYLEEGVVISDDDDFDVLKWWMQHAERYPVLSMMARDVLAVPVSTVASRSAFSTSSRVIDHYRSRLDPETVQGLRCAQDWIRDEMEASLQVESEVGLSTIFSGICLSKVVGMVDEESGSEESLSPIFKLGKDSKRGSKSSITFEHSFKSVFMFENVLQSDVVGIKSYDGQSPQVTTIIFFHLRQYKCMV